MKSLPAFDQSRQQLLYRNEELVKEVVRLKGELSLCKRKISALLIWKLSYAAANRTDASTQTDIAWSNPRKVHESVPITPEHAFKTPPSVSAFAYQTPDAASQSNQEHGSRSTSSRKSAHSCSSQERVTDVLEERVRAEVSPEPVPMPAPVFVSERVEPGRTPRSVRKPVSYAEPSLRVKVRKGFKFFKFEDLLAEAQESSGKKKNAHHNAEEQ